MVSKVFYQTQPRQCGSSGTKEAIAKSTPAPTAKNDEISFVVKNQSFVEFYNPAALVSYNQNVNRDSSSQLIPNLVVRGDGTSSFVELPSPASKGK